MKAMKRELDAVRAPKVDQNNYYGLYYRFHLDEIAEFL